MRTPAHQLQNGRLFTESRFYPAGARLGYHRKRGGQLIRAAFTVLSTSLVMLFAATADAGWSFSMSISVTGCSQGVPCQTVSVGGLFIGPFPTFSDCSQLQSQINSVISAWQANCAAQSGGGVTLDCKADIGPCSGFDDPGQNTSSISSPGPFNTRNQYTSDEDYLDDTIERLNEQFDAKVEFELPDIEEYEDLEVMTEDYVEEFKPEEPHECHDRIQDQIDNKLEESHRIAREAADKALQDALADLAKAMVGKAGSKAYDVAKNVYDKGTCAYDGMEKFARCVARLPPVNTEKYWEGRTDDGGEYERRSGECHSALAAANAVYAECMGAKTLAKDAIKEQLPDDLSAAISRVENARAALQQLTVDQAEDLGTLLEQAAECAAKGP